MRAAGDARRAGLFGFGSAAHLIAQAAVHEGREVRAFTRPRDAAGQAFARQLGAVWAGGSDQPSPVPLDAALIFAPTARSTICAPAASKAPRCWCLAPASTRRSSFGVRR